jgi:2-phospho-L-lactate guanylyltransferase
MMINRAAPKTWAILPVKTVESAKQRLSDVLSGRERQQLFHEMLADVMAAISDSKCLAGLAMVTRDPVIIKLGNQIGARIFKVDIDSGQSAAVSFAARSLASDGIENTISIPGDVPLMSGTEIDAVCRSIEDAPSVTIVPNFDGTGTNSLACSPPDVIPYEFGSNSFARHSNSASNAAIACRVLRLPGLGLDIDDRDDLINLLQRDAATRTHSFLTNSGIAARLLATDCVVATGRTSQ